MANEPGQAVLTIFNQLVELVKQSRPVRSDGKPLGNDYFYSILTLGQPVWTPDYANPWSPMAGDSLQQTVAANGTINPPQASSSSSSTTASSSTAGASSAPAAPTIDPVYERAMWAAYNTSVLCDVLLQVTGDDQYYEYPTGRQIHFAYNDIIQAMTAEPPPPLDPSLQNQINKANAILFVPDPYGGPLPVPSPAYLRYQQNAMAYAQAKAMYADAQAAATSNSVKAQTWPMDSVPLQEGVNQAYDLLTAEGAAEIEQALDTLGAIGQPMEAAAIKDAKQLYDAWNLGITGVPAPIPYSNVYPTDWCNPEDQTEGFEKLTVTQSDYQATDVSGLSRGNQGSWSQSSSTTGGGGGVSIGFATFGGGGSSSSSQGQWQGSSQWSYSNDFSNTATDLTIELEWGLVKINRPWLVADLFSMKNWYLVNYPKDAISDGTVKGQILNHDKLLPALPLQFLVIRNVRISSSSWGEDGQVLQKYYSGYQGSTQASSSSEQGGGGVCLGFISFGGEASHSQQQSSGQGSDASSRNNSYYFGTTFDGETLELKGAQIVAYVCDIIPESPLLSDPMLGQSSSSSSTSSSATTTTPASTTTTTTPASTVTTTTPASATTTTTPASTTSN